MSRLLEFSDHSKIIQEVADSYTAWRENYGAPRSQSATLQMVEDVISPILYKLSEYKLWEESAMATLEDIKNLVLINHPTSE